MGLLTFANTTLSSGEKPFILQIGILGTARRLGCKIDINSIAQHSKCWSCCGTLCGLTSSSIRSVIHSTRLQSFCMIFALMHLLSPTYLFHASCCERMPTIARNDITKLQTMQAQVRQRGLQGGPWCLHAMFHRHRHPWCVSVQCCGGVMPQGCPTEITFVFLCKVRYNWGRHHCACKSESKQKSMCEKGSSHAQARHTCVQCCSQLRGYCL